MSLNETYKRDLLRKYLEGSITDMERHELEKIALDDPFIFDAMEGAMLNQASHKANINELQSKLNAKDTKVIRPTFWKRISVAAGVLVLVGSLFFVNRQFNSNQDVAAVQETHKSTDFSEEKKLGGNWQKMSTKTKSIRTGAAKTERANSTNSSTAANKESSSPIVAHKKEASISKELRDEESTEVVEELEDSYLKNLEQATTEKYDQVRDVQTDGVVLNTYESNVITTETKVTKNAEIEEVASYPASSPQIPPSKSRVQETQIPPTVESKRTARAPTEEISKASSETYSNVTKTEKDALETSAPSALEQEQTDDFINKYDILVNPSYGTVKDENGEALIGANVYVTGSTIGIVTDFDGKFELPDSVTYPVVLEVSYVGYNNASMLLQEPTPNIAFVMDTEGLVLEEVVVASRKERRKQSSEADGLSSDQSSAYDVSQVHFVEGNSFPEIGGTQFDKYFAEELERRNACMQQGTYQFEFVVKRNGKLSDVNLATPVNVNCEEILIEIFEKGGDWIPKERRGKTYTQYTLKIP